jgi:hypothetical protein
LDTLIFRNNYKSFILFLGKTLILILIYILYECFLGDSWELLTAAGCCGSGQQETSHPGAVQQEGDTGVL